MMTVPFCDCVPSCAILTADFAFCFPGPQVNEHSGLCSASNLLSVLGHSKEVRRGGQSLAFRLQRFLLRGCATDFRSRSGRVRFQRVSNSSISVGFILYQPLGVKGIGSISRTFPLVIRAICWAFQIPLPPSLALLAIWSRRPSSRGGKMIGGWFSPWEQGSTYSVQLFLRFSPKGSRNLDKKLKLKPALLEACENSVAEQSVHDVAEPSRDDDAPSGATIAWP
jgi:hypothetical protein